MNKLITSIMLLIIFQIISIDFPSKNRLFSRTIHCLEQFLTLVPPCDYNGAVDTHKQIPHELISFVSVVFRIPRFHQGGSGSTLGTGGPFGGVDGTCDRAADG